MFCLPNLVWASLNLLAGLGLTLRLPSLNAETTGLPVNRALGPAALVPSHPVPEKAFQDPF